MKKKNSKKGISLVELILATAISVVVMAAACVVMYSGMRGAADGTAGCVNQGDANLLETTLQNDLYKAYQVDSSSLTLKDAANHVQATASFDSSGNLVVKKGSTIQVSVSGIEQLDIDVTEAGAIRPKANYVIHAKSGDNKFTLTGGIVMGNMKWSGSGLHETITPAGNTIYMEVHK